MKNNKWLLNFVFGIFGLVVLPFSLVQATEETVVDLEMNQTTATVKVNICHENGNSGNWNVLNVSENGWNEQNGTGHIGHGDFIYTGGDLSNQGQSDWCAANKPTPPTPQTATISAKKIVCDNESDLPNWGAGGLDISSTTASSFVSENEGCEIVPWTFEWSADGVGNPGDNVVTGDDDWNIFTDPTLIPAGARVWVREQMDSDYIPFTGANTDQPISAEFYCNTDVLNYDNWDWIDPVVAGGTYYCVGFNVLKEKPKQCDVVSDETNIIEDGLAAIETYNYSHPTWFDETALGGAAKWIWETFKVVDPTVDTTKVFVKKFNLDSIPTTADIEVAADNGFKLEINNDVIADNLTIENNFGTLKSYDVLSSLAVGENTIRMTVKNFKLAGSTPESNPAGALYKLHIADSSCSDIPDLCKNMNGYQTKTPEGYEVDDSGNCLLSCNPEINLLTNGGFEEPVVTNSNKWDTFTSGTLGLGWLVEWISGGIGGLELQAGVNGWLPDEANQYAELDSTKATKIWQDVPTILGKTYKLKFAYSPRPYVSDNSIEVYSDGNLLDTLSSDGTSNSNTTWSLKSYEFTADDETKIEFKDVSNSDSFGGFLDRVGLYCQNESEEDLCLNMDEIQTSVPDGYHQEDGNYCFPDEDPVIYACSDDIDNDDSEDSLVDINDPACHTDGNVYNISSYDPYIDSETNGDNVAQCSDGIDNDQDGDIDYQATGGGDQGCTSTEDNNETNDTPPTYVCSDGLDNDGDGAIDGQDPGCDDETDNDETNYQEPTDLCPNIAGDQEVVPSGKVLRKGDCVNRQRSGSISTLTEGRVLGASTCSPYLTTYIKLGDKNNDKNEVIKLQEFLNEYLGLNLPVDGFYGLKTYNAVKAFQLKHQNEVLSPWVGVGKLKKENDPTGYVYKTTQRWINMIKCPELNLPMPELI